LRRSSSKKPKGYWADINNRRKELLEFADTIGFDPYDPNSWANRSAQYAANRVFNLPPFFFVPLLTTPKIGWRFIVWILGFFEPGIEENLP